VSAVAIARRSRRRALTSRTGAAQIAGGDAEPVSRLAIESVRYRDRGPVDLTIDGATCVSLTGPSGSGKTLLLRALADLDPHGGRVRLDGVACADMPAPAWRRQVAMLPAESAWWHDRVGPHFARVDEDALATVGFDREVMDWDVRRLSSGERQRLAVLRVLVQTPKALLLDEPTANLDPANVGDVEALLARYRTTTESAVLWVTHDATQARRVATRHCRIDGGTLVEETTA
jgi:ABC-type iron transport system FetAB ATPase subunit